MTAPEKSTKASSVAFVDVGQAVRATIARACVADLTARQWKTLGVVISKTTSYSKLADSCFIAEIAAQVYGVEHAERWQINHVGSDLAKLDEKHLIWRKAPRRGRPSTGQGKTTFGVHPAGPVNAPPQRSIRDGMHPEPGAECTSTEAQNAPPQRVATEKVPSNPEESLGCGDCDNGWIHHGGNDVSKCPDCHPSQQARRRAS